MRESGDGCGILGAETARVNREFFEKDPMAKTLLTNMTPVGIDELAGSSRFLACEADKNIETGVIDGTERYSSEA